MSDATNSSAATNIADISNPTSAIGVNPAPAPVLPKSTDDTADARDRQVKLHDDTNRLLAFGVSIGFFALIFLLFTPIANFNPEDQSLKNLLFTLLGVVATNWANIIGYYFGSSAGSSQKTQSIKAALQQSMSQNASS